MRMGTALPGRGRRTGGSDPNGGRTRVARTGYGRGRGSVRFGRWGVFLWRSARLGRLAIGVEPGLEGRVHVGEERVDLGALGRPGLLALHPLLDQARRL